MEKDEQGSEDVCQVLRLVCAARRLFSFQTVDLIPPRERLSLGAGDGQKEWSVL